MKNLSGEELDSTLQLVQIYFDTATFDDIERDKKIKTEAQLSLIGGTMGLLTGFSIMSGVEIIFFLFRSRANLNVQNIIKNSPTIQLQIQPYAAHRAQVRSANINHLVTMESPCASMLSLIRLQVVLKMSQSCQKVVS